MSRSPRNDKLGPMPSSIASSLSKWRFMAVNPIPICPRPAGSPRPRLGPRGQPRWVKIQLTTAPGRQVSVCRCGLLLRALVRADQFGLREDVPLHGTLDIRLGWFPEIAELGIERVELVEIPMPTNRRAGSAVAGSLPIVHALAGARRETFRAFGKRARRCGNVVEDPVHIRHLGRLRIWRVRIVYNQGVALGAGGCA